MKRLLFLLALPFSAMAQESALDAKPAIVAETLPGFTKLDFTVDDVAREALVFAPQAAKTSAVPVVFVFHGHGGGARQAAVQFAMQRAWPEAISVYMQGLNTPGRLTDPDGKKAGWQHGLGAQGDRDLKFFDNVLARLQHDYRVDSKRIYSTGHSNGGGFTYLLWAERGDVFAAVAPSASVAAASVPKLKPKPALHIAGSQDALVKFAWQQRMMEAVRKLDGCEEAGVPWAADCTLYPSKSGTPFVTFIHPGAHSFPAAAPALIVKFFKEHPAAGK